MTYIFNASREYPMMLVRCMLGANLVIPAQIRDELSCGQVQIYRQTERQTDRWTDAGNDNTPLAWKGKG